MGDRFLVLLEYAHPCLFRRLILSTRKFKIHQNSVGYRVNYRLKLSRSLATTLLRIGPYVLSAEAGDGGLAMISEI